MILADFITPTQWVRAGLAVVALLALVGATLAGILPGKDDDNFTGAAPAC